MRKGIPLCMAFLILIPSVQSCLSDQEIELINNLSYATNTTNTTYFLLFEKLCSFNETDLINNQSIIITNLTDHDQVIIDYVHKVNSSIFNRYDDLHDQMEDNYDFYVNWTEHFMDEDKELNGKISNVYNETMRSIDSKKLELEDIFDEKTSSLRKDFITQNDLEEAKTETLDTAKILISDELRLWDRYAGYAFIILVILSISIVLVNKLAPPKIKDKLKLKNLNPIRGSTQDVVIEQSDFKKKQDLLRELKLKAVKEDVKKINKATLLNKIDNGEITNEVELKEWVEVLKGME